MGNSHIRYLLTILSLILFSACAANPRITSLRPDQRARLNTIQIYDGDVDRPYKIVGPAEGLSCRRNTYNDPDPTKEEALDGVLIKAALLDADAVINTACQYKPGTDWKNNCWSSWVCVGDAIKYKE